MSKIKNPSPADDVMNIINKYTGKIDIGHYEVLKERIQLFKQMEEEFKQTVQMLRQATAVFSDERRDELENPKEYMVFGPKYERHTLTEIYPDDEAEHQTTHDIDEAIKLHTHVSKNEGWACIKELKPVDIPKFNLWSKIKRILGL